MDEINIIIADQDKVNLYKIEISQILEALGHPEALVTNESVVGDFIPQMPQLYNNDECFKEGISKLQKLSHIMGFPIDRHSLIWKLGKWLAEKRG